MTAATPDGWQAPRSQRRAGCVASGRDPRGNKGTAHSAAAGAAHVVSSAGRETLVPPRAFPVASERDKASDSETSAAPVFYSCADSRRCSRADSLACSEAEDNLSAALDSVRDDKGSSIRKVSGDASGMAEFSKHASTDGPCANVDDCARRTDRANDGGVLDFASVATRTDTPDVRPTGLANTGNMCFLNAVLQALLHARAVGTLLAAVRPRLGALRAPFLSALCALWADMAVHPSRGTLSPSALIAALACESSFHGAAQEDAHEFLSFLVDRLHEEMLRCKDEMPWTMQGDAGTALAADEGGWMEAVGGRAAHARDVGHCESPVSALLYGRLRSVLRRPGAKDSITTEPFHALSLDVSAASVPEALHRMSLPETIASGPSQRTALTRTLTIDTCPPLLVLHLKRFRCDAGATLKDAKAVSYPADLVLSTSRGRAVRYVLHAVLYHHGRHAAGGHYTCDVRVSRGGVHRWVSFDDGAVSEVAGVSHVLSAGVSGYARTAYILFYVRAPL